MTDLSFEMQRQSNEVCDLYIRRSDRDPSKAYLEKNEVKKLLQKIRSNHPDTIILKLKNHLQGDINSIVLDEIIKSLYFNKVCQALYFQNISKAMNDDQVKALTEMLKKKKKIWCMNLGENYSVSTSSWVSFCNSLPMTHITHLYISEHVISTDLKIKLRTNIRENRKKHDNHCSLKNIHVIEKCTNMWWNPINAIRHKFAADIAREEREREEREREEKEERERKNREHFIKLKSKKVEKIEKGQKGRYKRPLDVDLLTPAHSEYWAEGVGEGGEKPWKFSCCCGETCSSYEHFRYHPLGRMFECSNCSIWSHVTCVLGNHISDDDLEELPDVLCGTCRSKVRRQRLIALGEAGIIIGANGIPLLVDVPDIDLIDDDDSDDAADREEGINSEMESDNAVGENLSSSKSGSDGSNDVDDKNDGSNDIDDSNNSSYTGYTASYNDHNSNDNNHIDTIILDASYRGSEHVDNTGGTCIVGNSELFLGESILPLHTYNSSDNTRSESTTSSSSSSSSITKTLDINEKNAHESIENIPLLKVKAPMDASAPYMINIGDPEMITNESESSELDSKS